MMDWTRWVGVAALVFVLALAGGPAWADSIFDTFSQGEIIANGSTSTTAIPGLEFSVGNDFGPDLAGVFDVSTSGATAGDQDLEFGAGWASGNATSVDPGNVAYISERSNSGSNSVGDILSTIDDQVGSAGQNTSLYLQFHYEAPISSFEFGLVDFEADWDGSRWNSDREAFTGLFVTDRLGNMAQVTWEELGDNFGKGGAAVWGNRSYNEFELSLTNINADSSYWLDGVALVDMQYLRASFHSSGAIAVNTAPVPEPASLALMAAGLAAAGLARRRRRRARAS